MADQRRPSNWRHRPIAAVPCLQKQTFSPSDFARAVDDQEASIGGSKTAHLICITASLSAHETAQFATATRSTGRAQDDFVRRAGELNQPLGQTSEKTTEILENIPDAFNAWDRDYG